MQRLGGNLDQDTGSDIRIITILIVATFELQVSAFALASLKVWFQPFKALRLFHVQGSMFKGRQTQPTLPRFGNSLNVEVFERKQRQRIHRGGPARRSRNQRSNLNITAETLSSQSREYFLIKNSFLRALCASAVCSLVVPFISHNHRKICASCANCQR